VRIEEVAHCVEALEGVRRTMSKEKSPEWRYRGRLIARQLDTNYVLIRADFDFRTSLLRDSPGTFSVPTRYATHMMVVANFVNGDAVAIEDALENAWQLQRSVDWSK
jgi:hypothetical protein